MGHSIVPDSVKQPILLSAKHRCTVLSICDAHKRVFHNGIVDTLNVYAAKFFMMQFLFDF